MTATMNKETNKKKTSEQRIDDADANGAMDPRRMISDS